MLGYVNDWNQQTIAMLGMSLRGAARSTLTSLTLHQHGNYSLLVEALKQSLSPAQQVHTCMTELN